MKGSVYRRKGSSRWTLAIDVGRDETGKRVRHQYTYRTRREAEEARVQLLSQLQQDTYTAPSKVTVAEWLNMWLDGRQGIAETTRAGYEIDVRRIVKALGSRQLRQLTPPMVNSFYAELSKSLSPKTVRNTHGTLHKALDDALRQGVVARNVSDFAELPRAERHEMKTWTADELRRFLRRAEPHRFYPAFLLACSSGLRRSEVLGLRWRNTDLENGRATIVDTVVPIRGEAVLRTGETKSRRSRRVIPLDSTTVAVLRARRKAQAEERMAAGPLWTDLDLCFTNEVGEPVKPDTFSRTWKRLATEAGVPALTPHPGARHSWATLALEGGVPIRIVQEQLGHSSIAITADVYQHVSEDLSREAVERVAEMFR